MDSTKNSGSPNLDYLFSVTYEELRRLAASVKQGDQSATLNPTALVNEAWMRLRGAPGLDVESPLHFKRIAARAMRQILVEAARRRQAQKRGGEGVARLLPLEEAAAHGAASAPDAEEVLALEAALNELETLDARQAHMVEARFFGGLEVAELMELFRVSEATVMRDWRMARAWLAQRMKGGAG
ncbi:MAG: sigma-70 family RNA polymerase sigma factor [Bryobacterales bacterium]|nr:sigma-70 family RNA polymerase sigma factor [Bryobacterales bacterium]